MSSPSGLGAVEEDTNLMPGGGDHKNLIDLLGFQEDMG